MKINLGLCLWMLCGPVYVCLITGLCRRAESGEIPPVGDQCESAFEDQGKSDQLESFIRGRQYLREAFEFPGGHSLFRFHTLLLLFFCQIVLNKMFNFWKEDFYLCYHCVLLK